MTSAALARSRTLSIRAPIANEEEREQFQRRLALSSLLGFGLAFLFWAVAALSILVVAPERIHEMWSGRDEQIQLGTMSIGLVVWALLRRGVHNKGTLDAVDVANTILSSLGWTAMTVFIKLDERPDLIGLLVCTYTLSMRAALVPSTPARTALLGTISLLPLVIITRIRGTATTASPLTPAIYAGIWALLTIAGTTTTTWVIYGLRLQVRKAMQLGQYVLGDKIGQGGMGEVFRASHALLRREAALKLLTEGSAAAIERFEREVQITARLTHPNTVAVFDYGRTHDGIFYYAMEFLDGVSLQELVEKHGPQPPARVVHVLLQACGALREAHGEGLVHRDIKPANLMLTTRGGVPDFVKVLDFGLVKATRTPEGAALTQASTLLGTPYYMSPESILDPENVDGRADVYALGATAFYLLTGRQVFEGNSIVEVCGKHLHEAPLPPSSRRADVPEALDRIILECLAKDREKRPKGAGELARQLKGLGLEWTEEAAVAWWDAHPKARRPSTSETRALPSLTETLPVDLADRVAAAPAR